MKFQNFEFVGQLDIQDPFKQILRGEFIFQKVNGKSTYFTGNSLGITAQTHQSFVDRRQWMMGKPCCRRTF
jgi:hypothetical protein